VDSTTSFVRAFDATGAELVTTPIVGEVLLGFDCFDVGCRGAIIDAAVASVGLPIAMADGRQLESGRLSEIDAVTWEVRNAGGSGVIANGQLRGHTEVVIDGQARDLSARSSVPTPVTIDEAAGRLYMVATMRTSDGEASVRVEGQLEAL
jgi:hypothetical protein